MRGVFFNEFKSLMKVDKSLFFITGDTGYDLVEEITSESAEEESYIQFRM